MESGQVVALRCLVMVVCGAASSFAFRPPTSAPGGSLSLWSTVYRCSIFLQSLSLLCVPTV